MTTAAQCILSAARRNPLSALAIVVLVSVANSVASLPARAQSGAIVGRGDAIVTSFAGTRAPSGALPASVHPLDRTFIDPQGITTRILDLSSLGGPARGQLAEAPIKFRLLARDVGHVFGIAVDSSTSPSNIFLTATSMFGLHIVAAGQDGGQRRVLLGEPGARFMSGLFGDRGGPGSIYRVDGSTGSVSLLANVRTEGRLNGGPGLGNIAFDARSRRLFVSDLESGLIHRLSLDGQQQGSFDHGVTARTAAGLPAIPDDPSRRADITTPAFNSEDPTTWGYAPRGRMVWGVAVENGRLYYSVAEGPQIWSVGINANGEFGSDARLELDIAGTPAGNAVTSIVFDGADTMYVAQRGAVIGSYDYGAFAKPRDSVVQRYRWLESERKWSAAAEEYAIGLQVEHRWGVGGIALGYGYDRTGNIDLAACRRTLWSTGEHLRSGDDMRRVANGGPRVVHGLQGNDKGAVRPENEPPYSAWFVDADGRFTDAAVHGHVGNVAILSPCESVRTDAAASEPTPDDPDIEVEKRCFPSAIGGKVRCHIEVRNKGRKAPDTPVIVSENATILYGPGAGTPVAIEEASFEGSPWSCSPTPNTDFSCSLPGTALGPGVSHSFDVWIDTRELIVNGNLGFRNCATIRHRYGAGKSCAEGGADIQIRKVGPGTCQPGGLCKFGLTLTNNSDQPYNADLVLADAMFISNASVTAPIKALAPPLGCNSGEPVSLPFSCVAGVSLAPGERRTHWITVQMPAQPDAWVQNCAGATDPWLITDAGVMSRILVPAKIDARLGDRGYPSCVSVRLPGASPAVKSGTGGPITLLPPSPYCPDGRPRLEDGRCACPLSAPYNPDTGRCESPRPACFDSVRMRPDGYCCPWGQAWSWETRSCEAPRSICRDASRRRPDGGCCAFGTVWNWERASCAVPAPRCPDGRLMPASGWCGTCPPGRRWNPVLRACEAPVDICSDASRRRSDGGCCPAGSVWDPRFRICGSVDACPSDRRLAGGTCCPAAMRAIGNVCTPIVVTCPYGLRRDGARCVPIVCPTGMKRDVSGRCAPDVVGPCRPGYVRHSPTGPCTPPVICGAGMRKDGDRCVPITCGAGMMLRGGSCEPVACGPGMIRKGASCEPVACGPGMIRKGASCEPVACGPGMIRKGASCEPVACGPGMIRKGASCEPVACGPGMIRKGASCEPVACGPGMVRKGASCEPVACGPGMVRKGASCEPVACGPGMIRKGASCEPVACGPGMVRKGASCEPVACGPGMVRKGASCEPVACGPGMIRKGASCEPVACGPGMVRKGASCEPVACGPGMTRGPSGSCLPSACPAGTERVTGGACRPVSCGPGMKRNPIGGCVRDVAPPKRELPPPPKKPPTVVKPPVRTPVHRPPPPRKPAPVLKKTTPPLKKAPPTPVRLGGPPPGMRPHIATRPRPAVMSPRLPPRASALRAAPARAAPFKPSPPPPPMLRRR